MIELNSIDFSLLNRFFGISTAKISSEYANKDIGEIMELEAQNGNKKAENYQQILSDPDKIYEIFRLSNVENRYAILQNMSEQDLDDLLPLLNQEQLSVGLNFFTEEKLVQMCENLPTEALVGMIFEKFNLNDVMQFMDDSSMNKFLVQPDVERKYAQKYFESLDQKSLEKIMVQEYGKDYKDKTKGEYLTELENLKDTDYTRFLTGMERNSKMGLINGIVGQDSDLLTLFENKDLVMPMNMLMKGEKVKLMENLDPEFLIPMIQELPLDLTQIVMTQIDPRDFADVLSEDFQDVLSSVVLFKQA